MSKKIVLFFSIVIYFCLCTSNVHAQISIILQQPPPGQLNTEHLWVFNITNSSQYDYNVYIRGTAEEFSEGLIFEGNTQTFILEAGYSGPINLSDISPVEVDYVNDDYEEIVLKTGTLPEGTYEVCLFVIYAANGEELNYHCITQQVIHPSPPELITPADNEVVEDALPVFVWMPPIPLPAGEFVTYEIKIVELLDGQIAREAMEANPAWFTEEGIPATTFQYPLYADEFGEGLMYAWQITAMAEDENWVIGKSEVWLFAIGGQFGIEVDSIFVDCSKNPRKLGLYDFSFYVTSPGTNLVDTNLEVTFINSTPPTSPTIFPTPLDSTNISPGDQVILIGKIDANSNTYLNEICFLFKLSDVNDPINLAQIQVCVTDLECLCCEDFEMIYSIQKTVPIHTPNIKTFDEIVLQTTFTSQDTFIRVYAEVVHYEHNYLYPNKEICKALCNKDAKSYGTFTDGPGWITQEPQHVNFLAGNWNPVIYNNSDGSHTSRELIWESPTSPGVDFSNGIPNYVVIGVPEYNTCDCPDEFEICIRYSFEDIDCLVCEVVVCYEISRNDDTISQVWDPVDPIDIYVPIGENP